MENTYGKIVRLKKTDIAAQILALPCVVPLFFSWEVGPYALYLVAVVQCISCLFWYAYTKEGVRNVPQPRGARNLRRLFIIVMIIHGICLLMPPAFLYLALFMLLAGPPLGIAYFVLTVREHRCYKALAAAEAQQFPKSENN